MLKFISRLLALSFVLAAAAPAARADWLEIQSVDIPDQPFQELYTVVPQRSERLLVTKDPSCEYVRVSYNAFGRDQTGQLRLQLILAPGAAAEDPAGRRGQTYAIQPGQFGGATIFELQVFKQTYDRIPPSGCSYHFYVQY